MSFDTAGYFNTLERLEKVSDSISQEILRRKGYASLDDFPIAEQNDAIIELLRESMDPESIITWAQHNVLQQIHAKRSMEGIAAILDGEEAAAPQDLSLPEITEMMIQSAPMIMYYGYRLGKTTQPVAKDRALLALMSILAGLPRTADSRDDLPDDISIDDSERHATTVMNDVVEVLGEETFADVASILLKSYGANERIGPMMLGIAYGIRLGKEFAGVRD